MTPVIPCSISNVLLFPGSVYTTKKKNCLTKCNLSRKPTKQPLSSQRFALPPSTSVGLFPQFRRVCALHSNSRIHILSATGTDVALEEPDSPVVDEDSEKASEIPSDAVKTGEESAAAQPKRIRNVRKSEMPPVKDEELVVGATFTGKVRSIQPFGAFVDFGAFTDGLVHVSQLSDTYVKEVGSIVSIGQEVKVRLVEANTETGRISLTMRENDDMHRKDSSPRSDKPRPARRNTSKSGPRKDDAKKVSKFVKGQDIEGTVKNLVRAGAFISLPEGEEGFLPTAEESDDGLGSMMGGSSLQVGQEVSVRVLRISRGQVTLTMKKEEDIGTSDSQMTQGVVYVATNPFKLAFRENKDIASFLDEREKTEKAAAIPEKPKTVEETEGNVSQIETVSESSDIVEMKDETVINGEDTVTVLSAESETTKDGEASSEVAVENLEISSLSEDTDFSVETIEKETEASSEILAPEDSVPTEEQIIEDAPSANVAESDVKNVSTEDISDQISSSESPTTEVKEIQDDITVSKDEVKIETSAAKNEIPSAVDDVEPVPDKVESSTSSEPDVVEEIVDKQIENTEEEQQIQSPPAETEILSSSQVEDEKRVSAPVDNAIVANSNGQTGFPSPTESVTKDAISPALVKQLRDETGAGMMDCKKALSETGGDIVKAQEFLRKKGLSSAEKKASRVTAEGRIGSYIHDSRIGVLVEVNCETDFVSRGDIFKELVDDLAMQVAAYPQVEYLVPEDVPEEIVNKEREIEMQKEDLLSKPEQIRSKIVEGRIKKRLEEVALLEQPYIKNDKVAVKDWVKQTISTIGENIKVKRFVRFNLGEGLEKRSQDFAAEVAAQTAAKPAPAPKIEQPAAVEDKETVQKPPAVAISAALVKKLREETGAGMMDCKKALSETEGDLEKAQEYLRKKGLSAADKKSSRIAAEGRIGSYIHDSRIGVLIEVNCETDFVARSEKFIELVDDLAMQVVASPLVQYVSTEDIPESIVKKEKELEMQREDLASKPENIREKIVEGRMSKRLGELALLEQPFIKNDSLLVKDLVKQTVAALGENIKVRRFVRFTLGESTDNEGTEIEA